MAKEYPNGSRGGAILKYQLLHSTVTIVEQLQIQRNQGVIREEST